MDLSLQICINFYVFFILSALSLNFSDELRFKCKENYIEKKQTAIDIIFWRNILNLIENMIHFFIYCI